MYSLSEENYLKAIYHLEQLHKKEVSTNALAEKMETKASSVTDMLKKMAEKNLVNYKKYQGVQLSSLGKETAINIVRKHRLWEVFLVEKLNFSWDEVHEVAEQLEHIQSKKLTAELDKFLGFPKRDPHGDPIPDAQGKIILANKKLLFDLVPSEEGVCVGVKDSTKEFLQYLDKHAISLGVKIEVIEKEAFDQSMLVKIEGTIKRITSSISKNLYISY